VYRVFGVRGEGSEDICAYICGMVSTILVVIGEILAKRSEARED